MAYAAITSFMSTISLSLGHQSHLAEDDKELMEVLYGKLDSLRTLIEETDKISRDREALEILEAQTKEAVYHADDFVESKLRELALLGIKETQGRTICEGLQQVIEYVDSRREEWMKVKNVHRSIKELKQQTVDVGDSNTQHVLDSKNIMVGYDNELELMLDQLVRGHGEEKVISLVGMGGIGKTTLATRIFDEPHILSHFDVRAKVTVSQEYQVGNVYLGLLRHTSSISERLDQKNDGELADLLQKSLKGRRYLVIIDDIWTTDAWDDIRMCFPFNNNGSRILLTTRSTEVAEYACSGMPPYQMRLLTFDESWSLLCQKVSKHECLTPEFEEIGKEIARKCQGLPLATVVMAGVLLKIGQSLDEWKKVVEDVDFLASTDLDHYCTRVLALSYYRLPHHLRACLLYLVLFKKSSEILVGKLIRLWAAEGFLKVKRDECSEMVAEKCLKDLIDRSLISVNTRSVYGKIKSCRIHDMIYAFCLEEAQNTNFLNIIRQRNDHTQEDVSIVLFPSYERQSSCGTDFCFHLGDEHTDSEVRSIIYSGSIPYVQEPGFSCFKLLRVLDIFSVILQHFRPKSIEGLFYLRYLAFTIDRTSNTPVIANLNNLQCLIIRCLHPTEDLLCLPKEIWGMSQLRYLKSTLNYLAPPNKSLVLEHLDTLSGLNPTCFGPYVLEGISNVKKLRICGTQKDYLFNRLGSFQYFNFSHLHQLESVSVVVVKRAYGEVEMMDYSYISTKRVLAFRLPPADAFPQNLKRLTLQRTLLSWKEMTATVSKLPKLEALKLKNNACRGTEWETFDNGFPQLRILLLDETGLALWKTSGDHFPCLERLILGNCRSLVSIPQDFADIMTLQLIELNTCKVSVVDSAKQIQEEVGDNVLEVLVRNPVYQKDERKKFGHSLWALKEEEKKAEEADMAAAEEEEDEDLLVYLGDDSEDEAVFWKYDYAVRKSLSRSRKEKKKHVEEAERLKKENQEGSKLWRGFSLSSLGQRFLECRIQITGRVGQFLFFVLALVFFLLSFWFRTSFGGIQGRWNLFGYFPFYAEMCRLCITLNNCW